MFHSMTAGDWGVLLAVLSFLVAAIGLLLGVPTWKLQRHAERQQESADRQAQLTEDLAHIMAGPGADKPRSPENPSVLDVLQDLASMLRDVAELQSELAWHISDGHGPHRPPWGRR